MLGILQFLRPFQLGRSSSMAIANKDFEKQIWEQQVKSAIDNGMQFVPAGSISDLVENQVPTIRTLLPTASEDLIEFVCGRAQRLFLTLWWSRIAYNLSLTTILQDCLKSNFDDSHLPMEDITVPGTHECGKLIGKKTSLFGKWDCKHSSALNFFHSNEWDKSTVMRFQNDQWRFTAPVFSKKRILEELITGCTLPFTKKAEHERSGHFGSAREVALHSDHQDVVEPV